LKVQQTTDVGFEESAGYAWQGYFSYSGTKQLVSLFIPGFSHFKPFLSATQVEIYGLTAGEYIN
jgi:hypothetical protein